MKKNDVFISRKEGSPWKFSWDEEYQGLVHRGRKNIYKLFFENPAETIKPIWIGLLVNNGTAWITWEKELGAKSIEFCGSTIRFDV
jgi:hypothetical protein